MVFIKRITGAKVLIDNIKDSIATKTPLFIKSYMDYDFNWEDMVNVISISYNTVYGEEIAESNKGLQVFNSKHKKLSRLSTPSKQPVSFHTQDLLHAENKLDSKKYDQVKRIKRDLEDAGLYADIYYSVHVKFSINLAENSPKVIPHKDRHHVLLTQAIGDSKYFIYEPRDTDPFESEIDTVGRDFKEYILEKNDMLFLPYGTIHALDNSSIRSTCIFDIISHPNSK
jgi:hypothetical protein